MSWSRVLAYSWRSADGCRLKEETSAVHATTKATISTTSKTMATISAVRPAGSTLYRMSPNRPANMPMPSGTAAGSHAVRGMFGDLLDALFQGAEGELL